MQNKGVIRLFAIIFAVACLWELSFTFFSIRVENDAEEFGAGDPAKETQYLDSISNQEVYPVLNYTYKEVKAREMNLGLDLKGGMNVILEVSVKDIIKGLANKPLDPVLEEALFNTDKAQTSSQESYLTNFMIEFEKANAASGNPRKLSDPVLFGTKSMIDKVSFDADDELVKAEITKDVEAAIANVYTVLRARIDQFGVVQPNIQRLENSGRILVELPGVKDPARVQKLLQSTAQLEFWRIYEGNEFFDFLISANEKLRTIVEDPNKNNQSASDSNEVVDELPEAIVPESIIEDSEDSTSANGDTEILDSTDVAIPDSVNQPDQFNPLFEVLGLNFDVQSGRNILPTSVVGYALPKDTSKVNMYLKMSQIRSLLPVNYRFVKFLWTSKPDEQNELLYLIAIQGNRDNTPDLDGGVVTNAYKDFDEFNRPVVSMSMNEANKLKKKSKRKQKNQIKPTQ